MPFPMGGWQRRTLFFFLFRSWYFFVSLHYIIPFPSYYYFLMTLCLVGGQSCRLPLCISHLYLDRPMLYF